MRAGEPARGRRAWAGAGMVEVWGKVYAVKVYIVMVGPKGFGCRVYGLIVSCHEPVTEERYCGHARVSPAV